MSDNTCHVLSDLLSNFLWATFSCTQAIVTLTQGKFPVPFSEPKNHYSFGISNWVQSDLINTSLEENIGILPGNKEKWVLVTGMAGKSQHRQTDFLEE